MKWGAESGRGRPRHFGGQPDPEDGARVRLRVGLQPSPVGQDNVAGNRQPQPRAVPLGGDKGLKQALQRLFAVLIRSSS